MPFDHSTAPSVHRWRVRLVVLSALLVTAAGLGLGASRVEERAASQYPILRTPAWEPKTARFPSLTEEHADLDGLPVPVAFSLRRGETLGGRLQGLGLEPKEARQASGAVGGHVDLRRLRAGDPATAFYDSSNRLAAFELTVRQEGKVRASLHPQGWRADWRAFQKAMRRRFAEGELIETLEGALRQAETPVAVAYQMADVLQWDLDFNRDLQRGDRFRVIYEEQLVDGRPQGLGKIRALVYSTRGRTIEAYHFDDQGYYDAEGQPLRKMFLRSPLKYSRVTSSFSNRRFHPILKTYRPHYGVDFGAPTGTPVRVTASGVVVSAAWDKGGGRVVKVRHANGYLTAYLHLSGYAKGVRSGARVEQGEVVGYVGSTGLATAPHLDYRVQAKGRWINPMSLTPEPAPPIAEERMAEFLARRDAIRIELAFQPSPAGDALDRSGDQLAKIAAPGATTSSQAQAR